ncbi:hypothetical protein J6590_011430 [Homalodisca vitripennis]|nr:hypothetical protein J6590_011430 [Homalodisca vitripennis]
MEVLEKGLAESRRYRRDEQRKKPESRRKMFSELDDYQSMLNDLLLLPNSTDLVENVVV